MTNASPAPGSQNVSACNPGFTAATPGAHFLIAMIAAVANGLDGRTEQAARWCKEARRRKADATAAQFLAAFPIQDDNARAHIAAELTRLGFG